MLFTQKGGLRKMRRQKKMIALAALSLCGTMLAGCSTTLGSNSSTFLSQMSQKISIWKNSAGAEEAAASASGTSGEEEESDDGKNAIPTPENWSVSESGAYSFDAVEGASYYIIYLYDKEDDSGSFQYMSANIPDDGSASYSGSLADLFTYCYGNYDAEVVAYPAVGDTGNKKSKAAECDLNVSGEVPAAEVGYLWDGFSKTFSVELLNFESYSSNSFPEELKITLTNQEDSSDVVTMSLSGISIDDDVYSVSTEEVTLGAAYEVEASLTWNSELVTNASETVNLGTVTMTENENDMTEGYGYLNSDIYLSMDYPMVQHDFDLEEGGSAGTWYFFVKAFTTNKGIEIPTTFVDCRNYMGEKSSMSEYHDGEDVAFNVAPTTAADGAEYSYTLTVSGPRDVVSMFDGFFWNDMPNGSGTLNLYADGTFKMEIITPESDGSEAGNGMGPRSINESSIEGCWTENGDGTAELYYDHTSAVLVE